MRAEYFGVRYCSFSCKLFFPLVFLTNLLLLVFPLVTEIWTLVHAVLKSQDCWYKSQHSDRGFDAAIKCNYCSVLKLLKYIVLSLFEKCWQILLTKDDSYLLQLFLFLAPKLQLATSASVSTASITLVSKRVEENKHMFLQKVQVKTLKTYDNSFLYIHVVANDQRFESRTQQVFLTWLAQVSMKLRCFHFLIFPEPSVCRSNSF